jgi:hypothetical protein
MKAFLFGFLTGIIVWTVAYLNRAHIHFWLVNHKILKG